jgi:hypothetical protein
MEGKPDGEGFERRRSPATSVGGLHNRRGNDSAGPYNANASNDHYIPNDCLRLLRNQSAGRRRNRNNFDDRQRQAETLTTTPTPLTALSPMPTPKTSSSFFLEATGPARG